MTDNQTPEVPTSPNASEQLKSFWNSLSTNAKIAIVVIVAVVFLYAIGSSGNSSAPTPTTPVVTVPTTLSIGDQYSEWKSGFQPLISKIQADYTQTYADISNFDQTASVSDFAQLSQDASELYSMANSPDATLNGHITDLASSLQDIATTGIYALNNAGAGMSDFSNAVGRMNTATDAIASDLQRLNAQY